MDSQHTTRLGRILCLIGAYGAYIPLIYILLIVLHVLPGNVPLVKVLFSIFGLTLYSGMLLLLNSGQLKLPESYSDPFMRLIAKIGGVTIAIALCVSLVENTVLLLK